MECATYVLDAGLRAVETHTTGGNGTPKAESRNGGRK
jgi:hypothetical protein